MAFQFLCPQGHLLQGDEAHIGMQTRCPYCSERFLIPPVQSELSPPVVQEISPEPSAEFPESVRAFLSGVTSEETPAVEEETVFIRRDSLRGSAPPPPSPAPREETFLHIPCPQGHELESPHDMLGQEALCPHCGVQFRLRHEDSREHREEQEKQEANRNRLWFNWSMAAAAIVAGGLLVLFIIAMNR